MKSDINSDDQWIVESGSEDDLNVELKFQYRRWKKSGTYAHKKDAWVVESDNDDDNGGLEVLNPELNSVPDIPQGITCYYYINVIISHGSNCVLRQTKSLTALHHS